MITRLNFSALSANTQASEITSTVKLSKGFNGQTPEFLYARHIKVHTTYYAKCNNVIN
jgi:hypothetical protein